MRSFQYTVQNPIGLHARPASELIMAARSFQSVITIEKDHKIANPKNLISILALNVNQRDQITVTAEGEDEEAAIARLEAFMRENL